MNLDLPTLALVVGLVSALQALFFALISYLNRSAPGLALWGWAALLNGVAMFLVTGRTVMDAPLITKVIPNLMHAAAGVLFYLGAAAFAGRRPRWRWPVALSIPLLLITFWFNLVQDQPRLRPAMIGLVWVMFLSLGALHMLRENRPHVRGPARIAGASALVMCGVLVARMIGLFHQPTENVFANEEWHTLLYTSELAFVTFWTFSTLMMINQRHVLEIQRASAAERSAREEAIALEKEIQAERAYRQRQLLVRDLHDGLGGITSHLSLLTSSTLSPDKIDPAAATRIGEIRQLAEEGNRELRLLMNTLDGGAGHWGDFLAELRAHAAKLTALHGIALGWKVSGGPPAEPIEDIPAMLSLLRAVKEALSNAARHGRPARIEVRLVFRRRALGIAVRDDGDGGLGPETKGPGRGLRNMRSRTEEMGGRLRLRGRPGRGSSVTFILPLPIAFAPPKDRALNPTHDSAAPGRG
jgi:signal transduction histidine kinase